MRHLLEGSGFCPLGDDRSKVQSANDTAMSADSDAHIKDTVTLDVVMPETWQVN